MEKLLRHGVSGLFIVGCLLFLPHIVISLEPPLVPCYDAEQCFAELLVEVDAPPSGSAVSSKAASLFLQMATAYGHTPWVQRARLRYGHALLASKPGEAIPLLHQSLTDFPMLDDYLYWWLMQAYVNAGLWGEAAKIVEKFTDGYRESLVRADVLYQGGTVLLKMEDCQTARSVLAQALALKPQHSQAAYVLFQIGLCAAQLGHKDEAIEIFRKLWWQFPLAPERVQAEDWFVQEGDSAFVPTVAERYQRGMVLSKRGALSEAIVEFQRVAAVSPNTPQSIQAQYQVAMALVRLKRYGQAENTLKVLAQSASSRRDEAWVWLGRTYLRQGKGQPLANLVKALPVDGLTGDQQAQLYTFYGIWLEDHDRWAEAVEAYQKAGHIAHTLSRQLDAWWRAGWIYYQRQQFAEAITVFQKIIQKTQGPHSVSLMQAAAQAWYWLARSQAHMGQMASATQHFQQIHQAYPLTYYGQLAQSQLGLDEKKLQPLGVLAASGLQGMAVPVKLEHDEHYQKFQVLKQVQFSKEALQEFEQVAVRHGSDVQVFPELVSLAEGVGAHDVGIRLAIRHFGSTLRTGQLPSASPAWAGAFPMGYQEMIRSFSPKHVDPFLVAGLIREESLYSPRVVSPVGAIGLMQLMPATAKRMAHQLASGLAYEPANLYQPRHNIQLGTHYLGQLVDKFQGNLIYSVAAYNAGPEAVQRWMAKNGNRPSDEFVELIGYRETRGYVKRVLGSYRIYRALFGEPCPGNSLDRFC